MRWHDAWYDQDEIEINDFRTTYSVETVGYLCRDDGLVVSIAQEVLPDGEGFRAVTHIPAPMVKEVVRLVRA